jgi:hypothetical protein
MAKVFSSIVKEQIMNHHPEMFIFQGGLISSILLLSSYLYFVCSTSEMAPLPPDGKACFSQHNISFITPISIIDLFVYVRPHHPLIRQIIP